RSAFYNCSSLTSVVIPDGVTSIGEDAFYGCRSLTSVTIGNNVTSIGGAAFYNCSSLTSVTIGNNVTSIEGSAFYNCSSLTSVVIPDGVTSIGEDAFYGCRSLTSVTISDSVTSIGWFAFYGCSSLQTAGPLGSGCNIEYGWTEAIPSYAFYECNSLASVVIGNGVTSIGGSAFSGCSSLTSVTIPDSVTSIGDYAFYNCTQMALDISNLQGLQSIGSDAFYNCNNLTGKLVLLEGITQIGSGTFYNCSKLESVAIPKTVTSIEVNAFYGCTGLKTVYYSGTVQRWSTISIENGNDAILDAEFIANYHIHQIEIRNKKDATCTEDGYTGDRVCVLCNEVVEKGSVIPKHHTPELRNAKKATIYEDGYTGDEVCRVCGKTVSMGKVIPRIAIQNGGTVLADAGTAVRLDASSVGRSLSWTITAGSASATVNNSGVLTPKAVTAEARVTVVAAKTDLQDGKEFRVVIEPAGLESLMIPTDVDRVAPGAFAGSESLKTVQIPDTVTEIGNGAFANCPKLSVYANPGTEGERFALANGIPVVEYPDGRFALETEYLLLKVGQSAQMNFRNGKEDWKNITEWSSSNPGTASVDRKGQVKALKAGTAYIRAAINEGGTVYTAECRIDVLDEKKQGGTPIEASLPVTKITTELLKTDYARIPVILTLKQNSMNPADVKLSDETVLEDTGVMIEEATFIGGGKADIRKAFGLRVADDRNLELVPIINVKDPAAVKAVAGSYKSAIHLKLSNGTETDTTVVTVTVKKSQPKLTAKPVTVNSFITGQTVPVEITGGRVDSVKAQDLGFATLNSDLTVTVKPGYTKNASKTVTLSVQPDDWAVATTLKITVKNQYKAPKVVLKPASVTVNKSLGDTAAAAVTVTPLEGMNHTISASGVSGLKAWYDDSTESVMVSAGTAAAEKTAYKVPVKADGKAVAYLSVKVVDASAGITAKVSGAIDPAVKNSPAVITVTGKNYNAASGTYQVEIRQNGKKVSSDLFRISQNGNIIRITAGAKTPADGKYTATVSCEIGSAKEVSFTVKTSKKVPAMTATLKAEGSIDILRGTGRILITPTIKNRYDYDENKLGLNLPKGLTWEYKNGRFIVTAIPGANINPAVKTATLTLDGKTISKAVNLTLKQSKATVTQSTKAVTLSKQDRYDRQSVILSLSDSTLQGIRDVTLTGGNGVLKLTPLGNGEYAIGYTNSKLPADIAKLKSTTVKLNVFLQGNGGAKADATLSVKVTFA
ncbi:MAG: leucine-rich repeat domain-containing protein, partial [Oscillospiraceae bacterium]|nr:leucine-rich repeat domain-containing protein [Oscillospiraceae bacterium]